MTEVLDTFDRANSTTSLGTSDSGHAWTARNGTWGISSNAGYSVDDGDNVIATVDCGETDQTVSVTLSTMPGGSDFAGVCARWTDNSHYYLADAGGGNGTLRLFLVNGNYFQLGSGISGAVAAGDVITLEVIGTSVRALVNGVEKIAVTDSTLATGTNAGLRAGLAGDARYNNFSVNEEAGPTDFTLNPSSDVTVNGWTTNTGETTNLFAAIDEDVTPDDNDYVQSPLGVSSAAYYEGAFQAGTDPLLSTGHVIKYRYMRDGGDSADLTVELYQGSTLIASWVHTGVGTSLLTAQQTLTGGEADSITDYTALRYRLIGNDTGSVTTTRQAIDAILASAGLNGATLANLDDDPDASDGSWATATGNNIQTSVRASFPTPSGTLKTGAGQQEFRALVKKSAVSGSGTPTARIELWENGVLISQSAAVNVTSTTGQVISYTWDAAGRSATTIECQVVGIQSGGSPAVRASVDIGALEWNAATSNPARLRVTWVQFDLPGGTGGTPHSATQTDPVGVTDPRTQTLVASRTRIEPEGITDVRVQTVLSARTPIESTGVADAIRVILVKRRDEPVGVTDSRLPTLVAQRSRTESTGVLDLRTQVAASQRTRTEPVGLLDPRTQVSAFSRNPSSPVGLIDPLSRTSGRQFVITDPIGVTDLRIVTALLQRTRTEPVGITDLRTVVQAYIRILSSPVGVTELLNKINQYQRSLIEPVGVLDIVARNLSRTTFHPIGVTDPRTSTSLLRRDQTDGLTLNDVRTVTALLVRSRTEALGILDPRVVSSVVQRLLLEPTSVLDLRTQTSTIQRIRTEALGVTESRVQASSTVRSLSSQTGLADSVTRLTNSVRSVSDSVQALDPRSWLNTNRRTLTDALNLIDAVTTAAIQIKILTSPVGVLDPRSQAAILSRTIAEPVTADDSLVGRFLRGITESPTVADVVTAMSAFARTRSEPVTTLDEVRKRLTRQIIDLSGIPDSIFQSVQSLRQVTDSVGIEDALSFPGGLTQTVSEGLVLEDDVVSDLEISRLLTSHLGVSDLVLPSTAKLIVVTESVPESDLVLWDTQMSFTQTDLVGTSDDLTFVRQVVAALTSTTQVLDAVLRTTQFNRAFTSPVGVTDTVIAATWVTRTLTDLLTVLDVATAIHTLPPEDLVIYGHIRGTIIEAIYRAKVVEALIRGTIIEEPPVQQTRPPHVRGTIIENIKGRIVE